MKITINDFPPTFDNMILTKIQPVSGEEWAAQIDD